jgi:aryl-alcohol dehydrogenase-like predicted oxidoreductase
MRRRCQPQAGRQFAPVGEVPYSSLARDILSGKYESVDQPPEGSRAARQDQRILQTELCPESIALAQKIKAHTEARGSSAAHFALRWVLRRSL